jgi:FixJ family two-component response regulator
VADIPQVLSTLAVQTESVLAHTSMAAPAELAATGITNREMAAALFISPKTVEANLSRIYRKLDIRSRAELGRVMGRADK